jgi:hypothetical protein
LVEAPATAIDPQTGQASSSISDIRLSLSSWRLTLLAMIAKEKLKSSSGGAPAGGQVQAKVGRRAASLDPTTTRKPRW